MRKWILVISVLFGILNSVHAQDNSVENVQKLFTEAAATPSNRVALLNAGIRMAETIRYTKGVLHGNERLLDHHRAAKDVNEELRTLLHKIRYFEVIDSVPVLIETYSEVANLYFDNQLMMKALETFQHVRVLSKNKNYLAYYNAVKKVAWCNHLMGNHKTSLTFYNEAIDIAKLRKDASGLLWLYQQKANAHHELGEHDKEIEFNEKVLGIADSLDMAPERLVALNNLGYGYKYSSEKGKAENYFKSVLSVLKTRPDSAMQAEVLKNLGILYQNENRYKKADSALVAAVVLYHQLGDTRSEASVYDYLSLIHYQKSKIQKAEDYNKVARDLAKKHGHIDVLHNTYRTQSLIYQALYDYEKALETYKIHLRLRDSLMLMDRARQNDLLQQQYYLERMEKELKLDWARDEITEAAYNQLEAEKQQLRAEDEAKASQLAVLRKDAILNQTALRNQELEARRNHDLLMIEQEKSKVLKKQIELESVNRERKIKMLELEAQKQKVKDQEDAAQKLFDRNKAKDEASAARIKNLLFVVIGLGAMVLIILLAYRQLRSKKKQIAAQQVVIAAEKEKSDQLLLNILPAQVAKELKENGSAKPKQYNEISVVFTDFVGFTMISEAMTPEELVNTLDKVFLEFDLINERHGLQRIKTIGDAYMSACGLPEADDEHAPKAVAAAIEMRDFVLAFNKDIPDGSPKWNIRIGVNSGPVVAGVVGIKKFAYDIWGDAVNIAARMESSGIPGKVNISQSTYKLVHNDFHTEHRGQIEAKNKGKVDMYFVERNAQEAALHTAEIEAT